ncbi:PTS fructose transporter subunit IIC [Pseudoleptotrichia goodfellowii]|uniref:PTS system mannitol/fructose-specific transporter subunit IIC n=1 Tax=Pseudoleptotrichia goodfellowii TaxID=157692 RepID=A0A510J7T7_9FUSO|nr:PTS fructose transporter subunit IIC [Pseudoleptotrichia goodfellowii]BBM35224.1 PTS system mannitol/fructose-specific transporter subunit IIC [Pseudoleptotrichia goodfellowii]
MAQLKRRKNSFWQEFYKHLMTGISYMIPVLIMGGLIGAFSQVIPYVIFKIEPNVSILDAIKTGQYTGMNLQLLKLASLMESFGFTLFGFAIPMFAAFVANSIGGKTALAAGFIGGYVANKPISVVGMVDGAWDKITPVPSGFLGAFIVAVIIGYFVKYLNKNINLPKNWLAFKSTFLIPLLASLFCMVVMVFVITPLGGWINLQIRALLEAAGAAGQFAYALVLSATTAFDLGGPVNKAAGFVALGFTTEKVLPITARTIAIVTPSIGLGLSTLIDRKLVGRRVYNSEFYDAGKTSIFLAFMGISEGAIPFALENPGFTIPLYVVSSVIGAFSGIALGAVQWFPESAIWAWPLVKNLHSYILGIAIGSVIIAVCNVLYRNKLIKDGKLEIDEY